MSRKWLVLAGLGGVAGVWAAATFEPLRMKPGLWEISLTVKTSGAPPMPPDLISRLTPEQRARMESARQSDHREQTTVKQSCLSAQELQQPLTMGFGDHENCRQELVTATATRQEIRVECGKSPAMGGGTIQIDAKDAENAKVTSQWSGTDSARTVTVTSTAVLKWLHADCGAAVAAAPAAPATAAPPVKPVPRPAPAAVTRAAPAAPASDYYKLGKAQAEKGDLAGALESFGRAIQAHAGDATIYNARGYVYLRMGNYRAAIEDFSQAIRLRPDYKNALENRAVAQKKMNAAEN
jgi:TolA-binding protein